MAEDSADGDVEDPADISTRRDFARALRAVKGVRSYADITSGAYKLLTRYADCSEKLPFDPQTLPDSTVSDWVNGIRLPSPDKLQTFLTVCDVPSEQFHHWLHALDRVSSSSPASFEPQVTLEAPPEAPAKDTSFLQMRTLASSGFLRAAAALTALGILTVLAVLAIDGGGTPEPPDRTIVVQNKVAIGRNGLPEDDTRAYLSSEAHSFCEAKGCKIDDTDLNSGDAVWASCYVRSEMMYNYDLRDLEVTQNPHKFESDLWYRARHANGKVGFLSEIWVESQFRGGLDLPLCPPA